MNHDRTARSPAVLARAHLVLLVRVGHLNGQEELAARKAPREEVAPLGCLEVALALLLAFEAPLFRVGPLQITTVELVLYAVNNSDPRQAEWLAGASRVVPSA